MRRLALCLLCFASLTLPLLAQKKPKENAQVQVGVRLAGFDIPTSSLFYFRLYSAGDPDRINGAWNGSGSGIFTDPGALYAPMSPNKMYQAVLSATSWQYSEVKFSAPAGYSIWINDRPATTFRATNNNGTLIFKIELREDNDASYLPAGEATMPHVGDLIWGISAGRYSNGLSAGAVQWRTANLTTDLLNPTSLSYLPPSTSEVAAAWHSDGALLELRTFQFLLYVRRNATAGTGYDIEIYDPSVTRTSGTGDGPYGYSASPYRTYRIDNPDGATWNGRVRIQKIESAQTLTWTLSQSGSNWTVVETSAASTTTLTSAMSGSTRVETVLVQDNASNTATKLQRTYQALGWGQEEMLSETANPDATNGPALTTTYTYNTTSGSGGYSRLDSVANPDGSWSRYIYDDTMAGFGNLLAVYRPWQDSTGVTPANAGNANCNATLYSYAGERNVFLDLAAGTETRINGTTVAKNTIAYTYPGNAPNGNPLRTASVQSYTAAGSSLSTTQTLYNPTAGDTNYLGRLYAQTNPDGTKVSNLRYQAYWWNYGDNNATNFHIWAGTSVNNTWGEYHFNGFSTQVQNSVAVNSWDGQWFDTVYMVPNRSTIDLDIYDAEGHVQNHAHYVFTGASGGVPTFEFLAMEEDDYGNNVLVGHSAINGVRMTNAWMGSRLSGVIANDGTYTEFDNPDALGRPILIRKFPISATSEYAAQGVISTHRTYDASSRILSEKISSDQNPANNPADAVTTTRAYNPGGLLTNQTAESGAGNFQTSFAYANGGRTVTSTLPGGATKVTDNYLDGTPRSVTGTAQVEQYYTVAVNTDGTITRQTTAATSGGPRWTKTTTDWAGRTIKEEHPTTVGGTTFTRQYYYNSVGQLIKTTENNLADKLIAYNAWQQPYRTGLDVDASGALEPTSATDRITETDTLFTKDTNAAWWTQTTTMVYNQAGNGTPVTTSIAKTRLNKYDDQGRYFGSYVQSEAVATDIFGNSTRKIVEVQRGTSYFATDVCLVTETTTYPDSSTPEITVTRNGLIQKKQTKEGLVYRNYYDGRGRLVKTTDPRTDTSTTPRLGYVTNSDRVAWRQDNAGNQTGYAYDSTTGRLIVTTDPLGKATRYDYTLRGELYHTWGDATYPVEYAFNSYGEQTGMNTYRAGTGWTGTSWPTSPGTADTTAWAFDTATGALTSKTDASSHAVAYTYNARGQLATRAWARGVTTTYAYSATTAEQTGITYSDSTPSLSYTYNRLGQSATVGDVTGTRTFNYSATNTLLTQEDLGSFVGTRSVSYGYDSFGRKSTFGVGATATPGNEYGLSYGYDAYGRMNQAWILNYTYLANSNLLASAADTGSSWTQTRTYESSRDLLTDFKTQWSGTVKAEFAYTLDTLGRRTAATKTGEMFSRYSTSGITTNWGYDDRSEVTSEQTVVAGTSTAVTGRSDAYAFDNIGNRSSTAHNGSSASYTANSLNQYTQRAIAGNIDVTGLAPAAATVTVNGSSTGVTRQNDWYAKSLGVTNTSAAVWQSLTVASSLGGSSTRTAFVPLTPEPFTYDLDGNLTSDGRWDYTYDAENRLVSMQTHLALSPGIVANADARRLEFKQDYLGRRVEKIVRAGYNGTTYTTVLTDNKFLYDAWNPIYEINANGGGLVVARLYVWGLDWSGTLQGAGGVGGLIAIYDTSVGFWQMPGYDGNGNVSAMISRNDGTITGAFEYDAFGNTLRATGTFAASNPFRFSTKYTEAESGLLYYGLRYYSPSLGRFINKDPLGTAGSINNYQFVANNPMGAIDYLGAYMMFAGTIFPNDPTEPGFWEGLIPIHGSLRNAEYNYYRGNNVRAGLWAGVAISDVFLVKSLATSLGRVGVNGLWRTGGSSTWGAAKSWMIRQGWRDFPGQQFHHWAVPQSWYKNALGATKNFFNQPWNMMRLGGETAEESARLHTLIENNLAARIYYGTPVWAPAAVASVGARVATAGASPSANSDGAGGSLNAPTVTTTAPSSPGPSASPSPSGAGGGGGGGSSEGGGVYTSGNLSGALGGLARDGVNIINVDSFSNFPTSGLVPRDNPDNGPWTVTPVSVPTPNVTFVDNGDGTVSLTVTLVSPPRVTEGGNPVQKQDDVPPVQKQ